MDYNYNSLAKTLKKIGQEEVSQNLKDNFNEIVNASIKFLNIVDKNIQLERFLSFNTKGSIKASYRTIYQKMRTDEEVARQLSAAQEDFQKSINLFNQTVMGLIYFNIDSNQIIVSSEGTMANFIKKYATKQYGRSNITVGSQERQRFLEQELNTGWRDLQNILNSRSLECFYILQETLRRWKNQDMYYKKKNPSLRNTYYWRFQENSTQKRWSNSYNNRGKIAEGYINALMQDSLKNTWIEDNISTLDTLVKEADNIGASKQQDIVINFNNYKIEFAVKTGKFSTARLGQYISLALNFLEEKYLKEETNFLVDNINFDKKTDETMQKVLNQKKQDILRMIKGLELTS